MGKRRSEMTPEELAHWRAYDHARYEANKDRLRALNRDYYAANKEKILKYTREWHKTNRAVLQDKKRAKQYGLAIGEYDRLRVEQDGRCAICLRKRKLCVDHDHETGKVRALLCERCNAMLGQAYDKPSVLRAGARYLELHGVKSPEHETLPLFAGGQK